MKASQVVSNNQACQHKQCLNQLGEEPAAKEWFYLLIEEERVGPFVRIGTNDHLSEVLLDRGIVIEVVL